MWTFRHRWLFGVAPALLLSCGGANPLAKTREPQASALVRPIGKSISVNTPLGLLPVPVPLDNPLTAETIALGEKLFFSPALSVDGTLSCASCHNPLLAFADGRQISVGVHAKKGKRNSPTLLNAAYNPLQFWDGRSIDLEAQASGPMLNSIEMGHTLASLEQRCSEDPELRQMFVQAFGPGPVTMDGISKALASFERTLVSGNSPFDRFFYGKQNNALSASAQRGLAVFRDEKKGDCAECHTIQENFALFTDGEFHNLGVGLDPQGELTDLGRYTHSKREGDQGKFRTPTLRHVAQTAPYMHDGSLKTLKEVVDFYVAGGNSNDYLDKDMKPLTLTAQERADLVAFLESLTGDKKFVRTAP